MFRYIVQHITGMVSMVRNHFQKSSGPSKGKKIAPIATKSTKKPTKRKKSPVRAVKKA
jgi:hypothetical protein